jgi:hypothetical protein
MRPARLRVYKGRAVTNPMLEENLDSQRIGTVSGGYRVLARIGSGTMGHVYQAATESNGRHVALKVLHKSHQKELAPRFLREGETLALLSHPNIVQLIDMGQLEDGALYLATELVPGKSLRDVMDAGALEPRRALAMTRQLLEALDAAHVLGVVHRDIKPENVMVADGDAIKVLDFGVAKLLAETVAGLGAANLTSIGFSIFGSALYIAPESVTGQPVDARLDLYSTGAMLFEMLTGRPVFDHEDPSVLLRNHAFDPPPTLQQVAPSRSFAPELEALVARSLAKKPDDRYASAAEMIAALDIAVQALAPPRNSNPRVAATPRADTSPPAADGVPAYSRRAATTVVVRTVPARRLALGVGISALVLGGVIVGVSQLDEPRAAGANLPATPMGAVASVDRGNTHLARGHAEAARGQHKQAVAAYELALRAQPQLRGDAEVRTRLTEILAGKDSLACVLAVELLAELSPPEQAAIATYASSGKLKDARHRAVMIAERDGFADKIDRIASWTLDLQQTSSCEQRKGLIELLESSTDPRATPMLQRARTAKCR